MNLNTDTTRSYLTYALIICIFLGFAYPFFWMAAVILWLTIRSFPTAISPTTTRPFSINSSQYKQTIKPPPIPDDLDNILLDISRGEIKDPVSQEIFSPKEKIYLCLVHRLAYHEDSWQEVGCKCIVCGHGNNTKTYQLPIESNIKSKIDRDSEIKWTDL